MSILMSNMVLRDASASKNIWKKGSKKVHRHSAFLTEEEGGGTRCKAILAMPIWSNISQVFRTWLSYLASDKAGQRSNACLIKLQSNLFSREIVSNKRHLWTFTSSWSLSKSSLSKCTRLYLSTSGPGPKVYGINILIVWDVRGMAEPSGGY